MWSCSKIVPFFCADTEQHPQQADRAYFTFNSIWKPLAFTDETAGNSRKRNLSKKNENNKFKLAGPSLLHALPIDCK